MLKNYVKFILAIVFASNVMAQNIPSYVPKDGLVGWWPFNENASDESGNGNHGTVNGATLTSDRNGKVNTAYSFDGKFSTKISVNLSKNIVDSKSFSFWVKYPKEYTKYYSHIISTNSDIYISTQGNHPTYIANNTIGKLWESKTGFSSTNILNNDVWRHVVYVYDVSSTKVSIYVDGVLDKSNISTKVSTSSIINNLIFGSSLNNPNSIENTTLLGSLDDIAIYNRALSDQEIKQLYEGCTTATSNNFSSVIYTTNAPLNLTATPSGGTFSGEAVTNNAFNPSKAKLGKNHVKYTFKNSTGCADSTNFTMILVDTLGNKCSTYDTLKIKVQLTTGIKAGQIATMNVYPNPTSDVVIIETSDIAALNGYSYKMVDLQGKQVYKELVTKSKTEISLKSIGAKGVYILHVLDAQGVSIENKKIVLE